MTIKQPLILLHGALGSKAHFDQLIPLLNDHFEVLSLNFEGHGGEDIPETFSIDLFAQNLEEFLDQNQLRSVIIFGYSMGGYVAIKLAGHRPELIAQILTYGTKFNWTPESAATEVRMLNPNIIEEKVPQFAEKLKALHQPQDWKIVMGKTGDMMLRMGNGETLQSEVYQNISCSVTIARGSVDQMVSLEESQNVAQKINGARFIELDNLPHPIDKINPEILKNYILQEIQQTINL